MEGLLGISEHNETLLLELTKAYCQYTYGWVENDYEMAEAEGNFDLAELRAGLAAAGLMPQAERRMGRSLCWMVARLEGA